MSGQDVPPADLKKLVPNSIVPVFAACKKRFANAEDYVFAKGTDARLREGFSKWARQLHFSDAMHWGGPHVLRHGGTQALDKMRERIADAVLTVFAQQSTGTMKHYAASAADRIEKRRRMEGS